MDHGAQMGIAEIMDIGGSRIEEGGAQGINTLAAPDDGCLLAAGKFGERAKGDLDRLGAASRQRHREQVHERALGLVPNFRWHVLPSRRRDKTRERWRDIRLS